MERIVHFVARVMSRGRNAIQTAMPPATLPARVSPHLLTRSFLPIRLSLLAGNQFKVVSYNVLGAFYICLLHSSQCKRRPLLRASLSFQP